MLNKTWELFSHGLVLHFGIKHFFEEGYVNSSIVTTLFLKCKAIN